MSGSGPSEYYTFLPVGMGSVGGLNRGPRKMEEGPKRGVGQDGSLLEQRSCVYIEELSVTGLSESGRRRDVSTAGSWGVQ